MSDQHLAQRYGTSSPTRRRALMVVIVGVAAAFGMWVAWAAWFHGNPLVHSELIGFEVVDQHAATARLDVQLAEDVEASCTVRATAEDHTIVGEHTFTPTDGSNRVEIRTERRATAVEKIGCVAPGQSRPR